MTFWILMLYVAIVFVRPQEWLIPSLEYTPLLDAVFALAMASLVVEFNEGRVRFPRKCPQIYLIAGVFFASIMSHAAHTYFAGMMATIPLVFKYSFFSIVLIGVLDRPSRLRVLAMLLVGGACIMALHVLLQIHRGYGFAWTTPFVQLSPTTGELIYRTYFFGIFSDPNDVGQWMATAVPLVFAVPRRLSFFSLLVCCAIAWFLLLGVQTTHSRGSMVGLAVAGAVTVVLFFPPRAQPWLLLCVLLAFLAMCMFTGKLDSSAHERVVYWGQANYAFKKSPIFGVGSNMIRDYTEGARAVHNSYVLCYSEIGLFGYWFWYNLIQLGLIGVWSSRNALRRPATADEAWMKRFAGVATVAMAGYGASSYFLGRAFIYPIYLLFALLAAVVVVTEGVLSDDPPPLIDVKKDLYLWGTFGALASVVYVYVSILFLNRSGWGES